MLKWAATQKQNTIMCICLCAHYAKQEKPGFFFLSMKVNCGKQDNHYVYSIIERLIGVRFASFK